MKISDTLLPELDQEMASARRMLERVPDAKWDWKPHAKSMAMGDLATHIMDLYWWIVDTLKTGSINLGPGYQFPIAKTSHELLEKFDTYAKASRAALVAAENDQLMQPFSLLYRGATIFTLPRAAALRTMIFNHAIHHRGQLSVYLRLNDVPVPGTYGPSADETM
jgi:uncharacterized damage-inducible protein DinB